MHVLLPQYVTALAAVRLNMYTILHADIHPLTTSATNEKVQDTAVPGAAAKYV